jgi:signal transduction histidine kinase
MKRDPEADTHFLPVLVAGFALLVLLLLASGFVALDSMRSIESDAARLVSEQQSTVRLVDEIQSEEGNLSSVFYSLASGHDTDREILLKRMDALENAIRKTTDTGLASRDSILWNNVRKAAEAFIAEGRETVRVNRQPSEEFFQRHQNLLASLADLTNSNFAARNDAQATESNRASSQIRYSLLLLASALGIAIVGAFFTIHSVNRAFRSLSWQATELNHLSSRVMSDQEETARRLANEMHDHLGQMLSAIEANLVAMQHARSYHPGRLEDCLGLLKDAVQNVREVSQLLRPSILDDFGLNASLRWLADWFA